MKKVSSKIAAAVILVLLLAAGGWYWHYTHSLEYILRKAVTGLAQTASKEPGEGNITSAAKFTILGSYLAPTLDIHVDKIYHQEGVSAEDLASLAWRGRTFLESLSITPYDITVTAQDDTHATAECEVKVDAKSKAGFTFRPDQLYHLEFHYILDEKSKEWKLAGIRETPILQR